MKRVLIPSDNRDWVVNFTEAYARLGWEPVVGCFNFFIQSGSYDLVHFLWPEEFCDWKVPSRRQIETIGKCLDYWASRGPTIATVCNLYPHGYYRNESYRDLFNLFFARMTAITHFSQTSLEQTKAEFKGAAANPNHLITTPYNYDRLLPAGPRDRNRARMELGFGSGDVVLLTFGAFRAWEEVQLVEAAFDKLKIKGKKLLMAGRYIERLDKLGTWVGRIRRLKWARLLRRPNVKAVTAYIPDEQVYKYFDAADAIIVPRMDHELSSGLPGLALTFGTPMAAPRVGAIPDYLQNTDNVLYEPGNADELAAALTKLLMVDRNAIAAKNRSVADTWGWDGIIRICTQAADPASAGL